MNETWFAEAQRIAADQDRDLSILASYMDPDPDKFMQWSYEPCGRQHDPNAICIAPNGHDREDAATWLSRIFREHGHDDDWGVRVIYERSLLPLIEAREAALALDGHTNGHTGEDASPHRDEG